MTSEVIQILIGNTGVQDVVGTSQITNKYKVYPFVAPEKEKEPFIIVRKASNQTTGNANCIGTLDYGTYEVWCWSKVFIKTEQLHEACRMALETGQGMWLVNDLDEFDEASEMYAHVGIYRTNETRSES